MKNFFLKSVVILSLFVLSFILMSMAGESSRRPMFGSDTQITTSACGECTCTYSQTTTYIFWIGFESPRELTGTQC